MKACPHLIHDRVHTDTPLAHSSIVLIHHCSCPQLHVPLEDKLARTVLKMDAQATEERERLKRQILGAASQAEEKTRFNARTERRW